MKEYKETLNWKPRSLDFLRFTQRSELDFKYEILRKYVTTKTLNLNVNSRRNWWSIVVAWCVFILASTQFWSIASIVEPSSKWFGK